MNKKDLELIFIRAQDTQGNWSSYSLQELFDMGAPGKQQIVSWLIERLVTGVYQFQGNPNVTPELIIDCLIKMENLGIPVAKASPELVKIANANDPLRMRKKTESVKN